MRRLVCFSRAGSLKRALVNYGRMLARIPFPLVAELSKAKSTLERLADRVLAEGPLASLVCGPIALRIEQLGNLAVGAQTGAVFPEG
jgi:hypothetical protein